MVQVGDGIKLSQTNRRVETVALDVSVLSVLSTYVYQYLTRFYEASRWPSSGRDVRRLKSKEVEASPWSFWAAAHREPARYADEQRMGTVQEVE